VFEKIEHQPDDITNDLVDRRIYIPGPLRLPLVALVTHVVLLGNDLTTRSP